MFLNVVIIKAKVYAKPVEVPALTEILKTTILAIYNANTLSNEYVQNVGHAWDREKLPPMPADVDDLINIAIKGTPEQIVVAMGIKNAMHSIDTYLGKLANDIKGTENESKLQDMQKTFLIAIVEKMLAKAKLDSIGKTNGLADKELETILGQKILQQRIYLTQGKGTSITPEIFKRQNEVNATTFYGRLLITFREGEVVSCVKEEKLNIDGLRSYAILILNYSTARQKSSNSYSIII